MTIVGAPLGFGLLLVVWPIAAFLGWVVASVWIGELIVNRLSPEVRGAKPSLAAVVERSFSTCARSSRRP